MFLLLRIFKLPHQNSRKSRNNKLIRAESCNPSYGIFLYTFGPFSFSFPFAQKAKKKKANPSFWRRTMRLPLAIVFALFVFVDAAKSQSANDVSSGKSRKESPSSRTSGCVRLSDSTRHKMDQSVLDAYIRANNNFSINMFHELYSTPLSDAIDDQVNLVFSPHSIWQAVVLSYLVSGGRMEEALQRSLGVSELGKLKVLMAYKALKYFDKIVMNERQQGSPPPPPPQPPLAPDHQQQSFTLDSANRIYFESSLSQYLNGETAELLKDEIRVVDFRSQAEVTRGKINDWVSRVTRGKIPELLSSDAVSPATIMALVNAAYFKGKWLNQFAAEDTDPATFILDNAARDMITVPTMKLRDALLPVGVSETLKATVVELPYASGDGNDLSMYVIVPASSPGWNLDDVLERFSVESFAQARDSVVRRDVNLLTLPKFKIETTFELLRPLNNLGLGSMFVPAEADFGCLSANLTSMAFSVAQHQAVIEVNEEGTEAAAATAFISLRSGRITPTEIKINRPFLYALYHKDTDSVLFMGVVRNPLLG